MNMTNRLFSKSIRSGPPSIANVRPTHVSIRTQVRQNHNLRNANCVITGASRGIGRAIAVAYASHGARCLLIGRDEAALQETQQMCTTASPLAHQHSYKTGDVGSRDFWQAINIDKDLTGSEGNLDVLVHAAGITHNSLFLSTSVQLIEDIIQTNVMGSIWGSRFMAKKMIRRKKSSQSPTPETQAPDVQSPESSGVPQRGHILFLSSLLATHHGIGSAVYSASKSSLLGLTRSLAAELGPLGIRVNTILPGYIVSDMTARMEDAAREQAKSKIPLRRFGSVEEVADAAVFLQGNAYANNCVLNLDGGLSAV